MHQSSNISVVIPAYNAEKSLQKTLNSLHDQSLKSLEIIVVDDGSIDNTEKVAKSLASKVIKTENRGPASARNTGIKYASGEIIALIDSDCQADKTWVENINRIFTNTDISVIMGKVIIPSSNIIGDSISALGFPAGGNLGFEKVWKVSKEGFTNTFSSCNCAMRKSLFDRYGYFDEEFPFAGGEDTLFAFKLSQNGERIKYCSNMVVLHEARSNIISFVKWQLQRGKASYIFKKKVNRTGKFIKTRLWSIKNVLVCNIFDWKIPIITSFLILGILLQIIGYCIAYIKMEC